MAKQILSQVKRVGEYRKLLQPINYNNIQAYVEQNMPGEAKLFLAKIHEDNIYLTWYIEDDTVFEFKPLSKASDSNKEYIYQLLYEQLEIAKSKLSDNKELSDYAEKILYIPSDDCLYYAVKENGDFIISLTKWGYTPINLQAGDNVLSALIKKRKPRTNTILHLAYSTGEAISNTSFFLNKSDETRQLQTNADGTCNLRYIPVGTRLLTSMEEGMKLDVQEVVIQEDIADYHLTFPYYTEAVIRVLNQFDEPCPAYSLSVDNTTYTSDINGEINLKLIKLVNNDEVLNVGPPEQTENTSTFHLSKNSNENYFTYRINQGYECSLIVSVNYEDGKPAVNYPLQVENGTSEKIDTDSNGIIAITNREIGEKFVVTDWNNPQNSVSTQLNRGKNELSLTVAREEEKKVKIGLVDYKKNPIKGVDLSIQVSKNEKTSETTDVNGFSTYPISLFSHNDKVKCSFSALGVNGSKKDKQYVKSFKYDESISEYVLQIRKKNFKWLWLLLLLLLIPLFFNFEKDIFVQTVLENGNPCKETCISGKFKSNFLYKDGKFFKKQFLDETKCDVNGVVQFENIGYSGYSFIFHMFSKIHFRAESDCNEQVSLDAPFFHFLFSDTLKIKMKEKLIDFSVQVLDAELEIPIVDADLEYSFKKSDKLQNGKQKTNAEGKVIISGVPKCSAIELLKANKKGYEENSKEKIVVSEALSNIPNAVVYLKPIKKRITFFVKNKFTKEPLPNATVNIQLNDPRSNQQSDENVKTDLDGMGVGFYDDLFLLANIELSASCKYYKDGKLTGRHTVDEFIKLPDSLRIIFLEPEPFTASMRNVDSLTLVPIAGVNNKIEIKSQDGNLYQDEQISNRNGVFSIQARVGDQVSVYSEGGSYYNDKSSSFKFEKETDLLMSPKMLKINFRTVDVLESKSLPNCSLSVKINGKPVSSPTSSGNTGVFSLDVKASDKITIESHLAGYLSNITQVRDLVAAEIFVAKPQKRDIEMHLEPCVETTEKSAEKGKGVLAEYDMKVNGGSFVFEYFTDVEPDIIEVFDARKDEISPANRIFYYNEASGRNKVKKEIIKFKGRVITVKVTSNSLNWSYKVNCPK